MHFNRRRVIISILILLVLLIGAVYFVTRDEEDSNVTTLNSPAATQPVTVEGSKVEPLTPVKPPEYDDPSSLKIVVNKKRPLPDAFTPSDMNGPLRSEAKAASDKLMSAASAAGAPLKLISGYRSQAAQANVYSSYVRKDSQAAADTYSARPRHSEHQTGLAADYGNINGQCDLEICFANTQGGQWVAANAHNYGFIIRYENNKTAITGYQYEPWHLRYVGVDFAKQVKASGKTLEEFFGLPAAPSY